ncbi:hypothetical protein [Prosthecobacter sp.]|uniref:hypothetical protein n=1 Tax=Prosthecobacter sp. TaxID=1965333 RepID=UPI003784C2D0
MDHANQLHPGCGRFTFDGSVNGIRFGVSHELHFFGSEAVGLVDKVAEAAFELEHFGGESAGGGDAAGVLGTKDSETGGCDRLAFVTGLFTSAMLASESSTFRDASF